MTIPKLNDKGRMTDIPLSREAKITVERRGEIVLIGVNRPQIAACGPLGIKTTLESAHLSIDESEAAAFAKLNEQFGGLFNTEDFIEGRKAEAEGRPPVYRGK
jgi:hypothetical protein